MCAWSYKMLHDVDWSAISSIDDEGAGRGPKTPQRDGKGVTGCECQHGRVINGQRVVECLHQHAELYLLNVPRIRGPHVVPRI
jgi:hypothetical protein